MNALTVGSMFSGIGLLDYGLHLAGMQHAWFAERDEFRRGILAQRWPRVPLLDDVRTVGADTVERVDVIAGGFPCKGASTAGKRAGFGHPETVLWREMLRAVRELRPRYVLVENVASLRTVQQGACFAEVLGDLASCGFDVWWDCLPAAAFGAPHRRDRVFLVAAHPDVEPLGAGRMRGGAGEAAQGAVADADRAPTHPRTAPGRPRKAVGERGVRAAADAAAGRWDSGPGLSTRRASPGRCVPAGDAALASDPAGERAGSGPAQSAGDERRRQLVAGSASRRDAYDGSEGRGIAIEWGQYEPAIRRWEAIHGAAPEPLVRRMDDRRAGRVERSRLSALGDGVLVHAGRLAGDWIVNHAAMAPSAAAVA